MGAMAGFEQQKIVIAASNGTLNGTFAISLGSYSTPQMKTSLSAKEIESHIEGMGNTGDVIVRRRNHNNNGTITLFVIFTEQLGNVGMLSVDTNGIYSDDGGAVISSNTYEMVGGVRPVMMQSSYAGSAIVSVGNDASSVLSYTITGLTEGLNYHVRVSAWNGVGSIYGATAGSTPALMVPANAPSQVTSIAMSPISNTALRLSWSSPTDIGGAPITA